MEHVIGPDGSPDGGFEEFQRALGASGVPRETVAPDSEAPMWAGDSSAPAEWLLSEE
jgi:hypothetical protein